MYTIYMKKLTTFICVILFTFVLFINPVRALTISNPEIAVSPTPTVQTNTGFLGQTQDYTVTFRGNGEAIVNLKVGLTNEGTNPLSVIKLSIPNNISVYNIFAYQVIKQPTCLVYDQTQSGGEVVPSPITPICTQYQQPDYSNLNVYDNATTYQSANTTVNSGYISITLPTPLASQQSGSYFLYYRSFSYTTTDLGGSYNYKFTTLKVDDKINTLQIGITTDSDLYLKNSSNSVNYNYNLTQATGASDKSLSPSVSSPEYNTFYNDIGSGNIVKNVTDLNNNESYSVSGSYADAAIKLYIKPIIIGVVIFILLMIIIILAIKKVLNRSQQEPKESDTQLSQDVSPKKSPLLSSHKYLLLAVISFTTALIITLYTVGIYAIFQLDYFNNYNSQALFQLFFVLLSFGVYIFLLFAPTIIVGIKLGWMWTIKYFAILLIWFALFFSITLLILAVFQNSQSTPDPVYLPQSSQSTK